MIVELKKDLNSGLFYTPKTIYQDKIDEYIEMLKKYFKENSLDELTEEINKNFINRNYPRIKSTSHETLAEGESNKYYQKAMCQVAIPNSKKIRIVRRKSVDKPKGLPGFTEGTEFDSKDYYDTLRGLFNPLGPNSGLTIEILD